MQIVCVSRGSLSRGKELAEILARKLDYAVLSREDLIEAAIGEGIQVGKLETAMMGPRRFNERLARERDHYLSFCTSYLCDKVRESPLVYHGRTGHLLLRGIGHVLRVRVVADEEYRVKAAMQQLHVTRDKARRYLEGVEADRRNWVRAMYGGSWEEASQYDVVLNVEQMAVDNAASALVGMVQLPDFQMTPASAKAMEDLRLAASARLALARDARTRAAGFSVSCHGRVITVTYLPRHIDLADDIHRVLQQLDGVFEVRATMATTNILWVQEEFDPTSETFGEIVEIAGKWHASVELVRYAPGEEGPDADADIQTAVATVEAGIEDDRDDEAPDIGGLKDTLDELARLGKSGGGRQVHGERGHLVATCCGAVPRSLVVVGNVFLNKGAATRLRLTRELQDSLASRMRVPVVTVDELRRHYLFGKRDLVRLVGFLALVIVVYAWVLTHQEAVLRFLVGDGEVRTTLAKLLVAVAVFLFVPVIAYSYGAVARSVMKLIKME